MRDPEFLLYRLNLVDRENLFLNPVRNNEDLIRVLQEAVTERADYPQHSRQSSWKWSLRDLRVGSTAAKGRNFAALTFAHQTVSKFGKIVSASGVSRGTSAFSPPLAQTIEIIIDMDRHIAAVEDVASIMQQRRKWLQAIEVILGQAARWAGFSSAARLIAIPPREAIYERIRNLTRITRIQTTLSVPNPDLNPLFKDLYAAMADGRIREMTQDIRSERGLNMADGTLPSSTLEMALDGYRSGNIHLRGYTAANRLEKFTIRDDVARIENVRGYVEALSDLSSTKGVASRAAGLILDKIDAMFPRPDHRESNETNSDIANISR